MLHSRRSCSVASRSCPVSPPASSIRSMRRSRCGNPSTPALISNSADNLDTIKPRIKRGYCLV
nr:MAG TPA: hypothetical protein [Caudoviricetes sp.]